MLKVVGPTMCARRGRDGKVIAAGSRNVTATVVVKSQTDKKRSQAKSRPMAEMDSFGATCPS
jgi:hypothetical protein